MVMTLRPVIRPLRLLTLFMLMFGLALTGCEGDKKKEKKESSKKERKPVVELFPDDEPSIPPPARGIEWGMTMEEASKIVPELSGESETIDLDEYGFRMGIRPSLSFPLVDDTEPRIQGLELLMYRKDLEDVVARQWGSPTEAEVPQLDTKSEDLGYKQVKGLVWFSADLRALAVPDFMFEDMVELALEPFVSAAKLVGSKNEEGFGPAIADGWLGSSIAEVRKANPGATFGEPHSGFGGTTEISFSLPLAYKWGKGPIEVRLEEKDGAISGYRIRLSPFDAERAKPVFAAMEARYGSPTSDDSDDRLQIYRSEPSKLSAKYDENLGMLTIYAGETSTLY